MAPLKILICGAGIAGNALAFWLNRLGHDVTVIERWPELRVNGLQIDLRGHGIQVLKRMGLEKAFRAVAVAEQGLQAVDKEGQRWAFFPANRSGSGPQSFTSDFEIMRRDLCEIIYNIAKQRTKYVFGTSIEALEDKGDDDIEVRFTTGQTHRFDLLVGADGQWSRTRRMMLGPGVPDGFRSIKQVIAYFTIPQPAQENEEYIATTYIATGGRMVMARRSDPHKRQIYLMGPSISDKIAPVARGNIEAEKQVFIDVFRGAGWQVDTILESMKGSDDFYCERMGLVKLDTWSQGRVVLLGDAAYCPTANTGMGTTSAIVGAYVLAGEIGRHCSRKDGLRTALNAYEDTFRPFMEQVQKGVGDPSILDHLSWTSLTVWVVNWLLWFACTLRLDVLATRVFKENVRGWDLPDYEELNEVETL